VGRTLKGILILKRGGGSRGERKIPSEGEKRGGLREHGTKERRTGWGNNEGEGEEKKKMN